MKNQKSLSSLIQSFFTDHLATHKGVSPNTIKAYRDVVKLFISHAASVNSKKITALSTSEMTVEVVLSFLKEIEQGRKNSAITRNHRLAVLRTLFSYLATQDPLHLGHYQKIMLVPFKRSPRPLMGYLDVDEIRAVLNSVNRKTRSGRRDYVLLNLLYNTGARVQEICDLKVGSLRLENPPLVTIHGKGQKTRQVPIWSDTKKILYDYLVENGFFADENSFLFLNRNGTPIGRFGVRYIVQKYVRTAAKTCKKLDSKIVGPHTFRHSTAMHLLQSGVDLSVIKSWLGHVDISTTHGYIEIDMNMKRRALEKVGVDGKGHGLGRFIKQNQDMIGWLEAL
jgi:site-specific recombinase XerD